jgi:oligopeptide/dipeptide ABC transporter ATP-binding protein
MYAGRVVERAPVARLFAQPQHPYTIGLMGSVPRLDDGGERLAAIEGQVPSPLAPPAGCRFHPRCPFAEDACRQAEPDLAPIGDRHEVACRRAPLGIEAAA